MLNIRELRQLQASQPSKRSDLPAVIFLGVAALAIGAAVTTAWTYLSSHQSPNLAAADRQPTPKFDGRRLGHAGTAPLLRICFNNSSSLSDAFDGADPQAVLVLLSAADTSSRLGPLVGAKGRNGGQLSEFWRELADCVYRQNSWTFCDIDNRALAVEMASAFIRQAARLAAEPSTSRNSQMILNDNAYARERVLGALRERLRNGQLIAQDFGPMVPADIKRVLAETRPIANGCKT